MAPGSRILAAALLLSLPPGDSVLITRQGERLDGPVARAGADYVVTTASGPRRVAGADVGVLFEDPREAVRESGGLYDRAKKLFEEASALPEADPLRNEKLAVAIGLAQTAAERHRLMEPHYGRASWARFPHEIQTVMQFIRICRGAKTSTRAGDARPGPAAETGMVDVDFAFEPPPEPDRPWVLRDELGPGLGAWAKGLGDPDPARRAEAAARLSSPPSPLHLEALVRLLETEREGAVVRAAAPALDYAAPDRVLQAATAMRADPEPLKRELVYAAVRAAPEAKAVAFLVGWMADAPPEADGDRAAFASLFRRHRGTSVQALKELLTRNRDPKVQAETLKQLGVIRDKAGAPMVLKGMERYPQEAGVALLKLGTPSLPVIIEGGRSNDPDVKRAAIGILRRLTLVNGINLTHFEEWWREHARDVLADEKAFWEAQAREGFPVDAREFREFGVPLNRMLR